MKKILPILILCTATNIYADSNLSKSDQQLLDIINQTNQSINFVNDISTLTFTCPSVAEIKASASSMKHGEDNFFKDNQQLTWSIDLPENFKSGSIMGFYDTEYQDNFVTCSYQIADANDSVTLQGIFYVLKPMNTPWMPAPKTNVPFCTAGQTECKFQLKKTIHVEPPPISNSAPMSSSVPPSPPPSMQPQTAPFQAAVPTTPETSSIVPPRKTPVPPADPTPAPLLPGEITG